MSDDPAGFLLMGKIVGVHGIRGIVKVLPYSDSLSVFKPGSLILLRHPAGGEKTCKISQVSPHKRVALFTLEYVTTRDMAESLVGYECFIEKPDMPDLEEGTYYWSDIIGLCVFDVSGTYVGKIENIIPTGSNDVYVAKDSKGKETLIPALKWVICEIDLENRTMQVDLPEGL